MYTRFPLRRRIRLNGVGRTSFLAVFFIPFDKESEVFFKSRPKPLCIFSRASGTAVVR